MSRALRLALVIGSIALPAIAAEPSLNDYVLTSWTTKDGLPSDVIWSVAQDREGYLWLGTNAGLARFDGVQFTSIDGIDAIKFPRVPVRTVHLARDGRLWIGYSELGGVSVIAPGGAMNYTEREGLPRAVVTAIADDPAGRVWAGTQRGLFTLVDGHRWQPAPMPGDVPELRIDSLFVDRAGSVYTGTNLGVFVLEAGATTFAQVDTLTDRTPTFRAFGQDREGHVWVTDPLVGVRRLGATAPSALASSRGRGNRLLFDHDGRLWVATMGEGLWRMAVDAGDQPSRFEKTRVSGARTLFEDRDGNIWAGAGDGLIRLRRPRVMPMTDLGLVESVATTGDGIVWGVTADGVIPFRNNVRDDRVAPALGTGTRVRAACTDAAGALWLVTDRGILRRDGRETWFTSPALSLVTSRVNGVAAGPDGQLWLSDRERGLLRWDPRTPNRVHEQAALRPLRLRSLVPDRQGGLWILSTGGRLGRVGVDGTVRYFDPQDGQGTGSYLSIFEDSQHIVWAGSFAGLNRFDGQRFVPLSRNAGFRGGVSSIVEDAEHDLWLSSGAGIVFIRRSEIERARATPTYQPEVSVFDAADGLAGMPISFGGASTTAARDGRLWFVTGRGLTSLDPMLLKRVHRPVSVKVERVTVDDRDMPTKGAPTLPAQSGRLAIDFTALDLSAPLRIRFRYRLEGFDADWIDAGTRRQAFYTHLPPRSYRFRVAAMNGDGTWNEAPEALAFSIAPMFYQTAWFGLLCALSFALVAWAAWQMRVRRIRRQFALLIGERARLSRELHDTLLQSLVGVALQFDAVSSTLEPASPAAQQLVRMRKQVEEYIRETRRSIQNLRTPQLDERDLATAIRESAERAIAGGDVDLEFTLHGEPSITPMPAREPLAKICHEAVRNAVRHARANRVRVELRYDPGAVVLRVADDGQGFDPASPGLGERAGHYGLVSMRERAEQVGGEFLLQSARHGGTVIEARVPTAAST